MGSNKQSVLYNDLGVKLVIGRWYLYDFMIYDNTAFKLRKLDMTNRKAVVTRVDDPKNKICIPVDKLKATNKHKKDVNLNFKHKLYNAKGTNLVEGRNYYLCSNSPDFKKGLFHVVYFNWRGKTAYGFMVGNRKETFFVQMDNLISTHNKRHLDKQST